MHRVSIRIRYYFISLWPINHRGAIPRRTPRRQSRSLKRPPWWICVEGTHSDMHQVELVRHSSLQSRFIHYLQADYSDRVYSGYLWWPLLLRMKSVYRLCGAFGPEESITITIFAHIQAKDLKATIDRPEWEKRETPRRRVRSQDTCKCLELQQWISSNIISVRLIVWMYKV